MTRQISPTVNATEHVTANLVSQPLQDGILSVALSSQQCPREMPQSIQKVKDGVTGHYIGVYMWSSARASPLRLR